MTFFSTRPSAAEDSGDDERRRLGEAFAAGEDWALRAVYDQHGGLVYRIALQAVRDRSDAEEVTQTTFVSAWRARDTFDPARGSPGLATIGPDERDDPGQHQHQRDHAGGDQETGPAPPAYGRLRHDCSFRRHQR